MLLGSFGSASRGAGGGDQGVEEADVPRLLRMPLHADHEAVEVTDIIRVLHQNAANACQVVAEAVKAMPDARDCKCGSALQHALITDRNLVPGSTIEKLAPIVGKYFA